jgi:AcrR family transcriptional regulator
MAVRMFLDDGYHRTSLNDVAKRLNITKPALYNYFRSKDDILAACYQAGLALYDRNLAESLRLEDHGLGRLRALIHSYAGVIATDFGRCVVRLDDRELPDLVREQVLQTKRRIEQAFRDAIALGMADGSIVTCDPALTSFAITGALNGIGTWFDPAGRVSAAELAESYAQQLTAGLARHA